MANPNYKENLTDYDPDVNSGFLGELESPKADAVAKFRRHHREHSGTRIYSSDEKKPRSHFQKDQGDVGHCRRRSARSTVIQHMHRDEQAYRGDEVTQRTTYAPGRKQPITTVRAFADLPGKLEKIFGPGKAYELLRKMGKQYEVEANTLLFKLKGGEVPIEELFGLPPSELQGELSEEIVDDVSASIFESPEETPLDVTEDTLPEEDLTDVVIEGPALEEAVRELAGQKSPLAQIKTKEPDPQERYAELFFLKDE